MTKYNEFKFKMKILLDLIDGDIYQKYTYNLNKSFESNSLQQTNWKLISFLHCLKQNNCKDIIVSSFNWDGTVEGYKYWDDIAKELLSYET